MLNTRLLDINEYNSLFTENFELIESIKGVRYKHEKLFSLLKDENIILLVDGVLTHLEREFATFQSDRLRYKPVADLKEMNSVLKRTLSEVEKITFLSGIF
jgi:hypothetical protein